MNFHERQAALARIHAERYAPGARVNHATPQALQLWAASWAEARLRPGQPCTGALMLSAVAWVTAEAARLKEARALRDGGEL